MKGATTTYLTAVEATAHLNLSSVAAFRTFLWRRRKAGRPVTTYRLNGRLRFLRVDLDAALTVEKARPSRLKVAV